MGGKLIEVLVPEIEVERCQLTRRDILDITAHGANGDPRGHKIEQRREGNSPEGCQPDTARR
ncbi:hypothetical protein D3C87_2042710 [compost metagenome]